MAHNAARAAACILLAAGVACGGDDPLQPEERDTTPPFIQAWYPGVDDTQISSGIVIQALFSEPIDPSTINSSSFFVTPALTGNYSYSQNRAAFTPHGGLAPGVTYTVTVTTAIEDTAGNALDAPFTWSFTTYAPPPPAELASVTAGLFYSCGLSPTGVAHCWGNNQVGQLGDGRLGSRAWADPVETQVRFESLAGGEYHVCGLTTAGEAHCWGDNPYGELGDGTTTRARMPVRVQSSEPFASIAAGLLHTCALTADGRAYCWGWNGAGQFGNGTTDDSLRPLLVSGQLRFTALALGGAHSCGLASDGVAYCWGTNYDGQLGDGTTMPRLTPTPVSAGDLRFAAISAATRHTCAVTPEGATYCWGDNRGGQLGDGTTVDRLAPVAVVGAPPFRRVTAATEHTCGLTPAGAAYCWGNNASGAIGDRTLTNRLTPVAVSGGWTFASLAAGNGHTCGATASFATYCWGAGSAGQLGNREASRMELPVRVLR